MELNYLRCPQDDAKVITATLGISNSGTVIELGLPEIATAVQMKGLVYTTTLAIKGGVTQDFVSRVAGGLCSQMGEDVHALCPVISILVETCALMNGGYTALDQHGLVNVYPSKSCPGWMRGYFDQLVGAE